MHKGSCVGVLDVGFAHFGGLSLLMNADFPDPLEPTH